MGALLHIPGLIDHQDRTWVAEGIDDVVTQIVTDLIGVPAGACQQVLQAVWGEGTPVLGDRPAILAIQTRDHARHQLTGMTQRLMAGEPRRDPIQHSGELGPPPVRVYAGNRGDRGILRSCHKLTTMPRSPP